MNKAKGGKLSASEKEQIVGNNFQNFITAWSFNFIKTKSQLVFLLITVGVFGGCIPMMRSFHQHVENRRAQNLSYAWPKYSDAWIGITTAIVLHLIKRIMLVVLVPVYMKYIEPKHQGRARLERAEKGAKHAYKTFYFVTAVVIGYFVFKDLDYMPKSLLCNGEMSRVYQDFPFHKKTPYFDIYYIAQIGYHLESFISHLGSKPKNDYIEMMLHHIITLLLIFLSYMSNYSNVGAAVMFVHDWGDVFVSIVRTVLDLNLPSWVVVYAFGSMFAVWIYTRLLVFPLEILYYNIFSHNSTSDAHMMLTGMLLVLQLLNIYWSVMFARIGINYSRKRKKEDIVHKIEKDKPDSQKDELKSE